MGVLASMQSLLVRQMLALKEPAWQQRYPNDWLVWEPGAWKVPQIKGGVASTQIAIAQPDRPQKGDCLCFELKCVAAAKLKVGRAPENDIVLNDATVSREHLVLERAKDQWLVRALALSKATLVKGKAVAPDAPVALTSGDQLTVGGVTLTYLTPAGLISRIKLEATTLSR
jgi:hypothetical protein